MDNREKVARAIFRAGFHDDEDEALVDEKWHEWPGERDIAFRRADAALSAMQGGGAPPPEPPALTRFRNIAAAETGDGRMFTLEDGQEIVAYIDRLKAMQGDGWRGIKDNTPWACCVIATYFDSDDGEWIQQVVMSPPGAPFTHWRHLFTPPSASGDEAPALAKSCPHGSTGPCSICGDIG